MLFLDFFFQAEDGIRDAQESRGLGEVYKRQVAGRARVSAVRASAAGTVRIRIEVSFSSFVVGFGLSLIHI